MYNPLSISYLSVVPDNCSIIMKQTYRIEKLLNQRMQFFESLFLLNSYRDFININTKELADKHRRMENQQTEAVSTMLSTVRIDEIFKKEFHAIIIKIFNKIDPRITIRKVPTGTYKEIILDYTTFFTQLKEKHIIQFVRQIFELQIYNQTTVIYVLLELMFKFLRIKCLSFITDKIQPQVTAAARINSFSYLMLNQGKRPESKHKKVQIRRNSPSSFSNQSKSHLKSSVDEDNEIESMQVNSKTITFGMPTKQQKYRLSKNRVPRSTDLKISLHSPSPRQNSNSQQSKRRVIKSFKDIREQTKQKIEKSNQNLLTVSKGWIPTSSQAYHRMFTKVFEKEWRDYMELTGLEKNEFEEQTLLKSPEVVLSKKKKLDWFTKNSDKIAVEACSRNDEIRKEMEIYTEQFSGRLKKT